MEKKPCILALVFTFAMLISMFPMPITRAGEPSISERISLPFDVNPVECQPLDQGALESIAAESGEFSYNLDMIDVEKTCATGEDIYIAVLDTGLLYNWIEYLPAENIVTEWGKGFSYEYAEWSEEYQTFLLYNPTEDRGFITMEPYGSGHGTHVTSTIIGYTIPGVFSVEGVAPNVKIIPVLVLDSWVAYYPPGGYYVLLSGGTEWMVSSGIRYVADLAEQEGIKIIISMSLGGASPLPAVEEAIDYAISKGCIVVAAAGNGGEEGMDYPGAYPQVISVAAAGWTMQWIGDGVTSPWWLSDVPENFWTEDDLGNKLQLYLTDFSSRPNASLGQSICDLDVAAPGAWIVGPYRPYAGEFGFYYVSGTSMATPHVSGIAALVLEKYPNLNQFDMQIILKLAGLTNRMSRCSEKRSAIVYEPWGEFVEYTWGPFDYGTGFLQADSAIFTAFIYMRLHRCKLFLTR